MATNDQSEASEPDDLPAKDLTDDVKRLLDQLAGQIIDADQRHSDSLQDMQSRLAAMSDRAAAAKPEVPSESAEALGRVEAAMAALANRLADAEPKSAPESAAFDDASTVLPETVRADLRRAIADGHREAPKPAPAWSTAASDALAHHRERASSPTPASPPAADAPAAPCYPYVGTPPAAVPPIPPTAVAAPAIERAWLEDRFAEIADRVETSMARLDRHNSVEVISARFDQLEKRFASALDAAPERGAPDAGALQGIEKQITGLFAELDRTRTQLGRLDTIESRLTELRRDPSDEQMSRLIRAATPTDAQLSAVAMAAAERVAERLSGVAMGGLATSGTLPPPAGLTDQRLGELISLMQEFIGEHRTGDVQTAEALDTMQQAMQHLIDRVEAIEAAQISGHDELMRAARSMLAQRGDSPQEALDFGFREQDIRRTAAQVAKGELPSIAVSGPGASPAPSDDVPSPPRRAPSESENEDYARRLAATRRDAPEAPPAPRPNDVPPQGASPPPEPHREAFIAMARRAAEKAAREPSPQLDAAPSADRIAGALGWARQLAAAGSSGQARRPRILLVASIAAFLLAGFWMLAGSGLRGMIPLIGSTQQAPLPKSTSIPSPVPMKDAGRSTGSSERATKNSFPGTGRVVEGGFGITIDEGSGRPAVPTTLKPDDQVQLASLSETPVQDSAPRGAASPETAARSGPVELPPATIGPLSLRHAAANGDALAQLEVASRFAGAKGVPQDLAQAATWYQRAAAQGLANAQFQLGILYDRGRGVAADPARARVWYGRAAQQGNVRAMHNLAVFSAGRPDASPDYPLAVQWFTEAAKHGLADSQYNLGILYESGRGVPASLVEAYKWYALAARSGDMEAAKRRDALRNKLEPESVSAVDTLVIKWRAKPVDPAANDTRGSAPTAQMVR